MSRIRHTARALLVAAAVVPCVRASDDAPRWAARLGFEGIVALQHVAPRGAPLNPGNRVLAIPGWGGTAEARGNLRFERGSTWSVVARPRLLATRARLRIDGAGTVEDSLVTGQWTELFATWQPTDAVALTAGRQNFNWGPAELLSPSNRLSREVAVFRDPLYLVRGRDMVRLNVSRGREWSAVAMAELHDDGDAPLAWGDPFRRRGQLKLEYAAPDGRAYGGVVLGARAGGRGWIGEYGSVEVGDAWALYADLSHRRGSDAWYPVAGPDGVPRFARALEDDDAVRTLAVAGVRYAFAGGAEARLEALHDDAGYDRQDFDAAARALAATGQVGPFLSPGLEFVGRDVVLVAVRVPDLPPAKRVVLNPRLLWSATDGSGALLVTATYDAGEALVLFVTATGTRGGATDEFSRLARSMIVAGAVRSW